MHLAFVNGFPYTQPVPFDVPGPDGPKSPEELGAEIGRRTGLADAAFANRIWRDTLKYWDDEAKPRSIAKHRELAAVDLPTLSDEELRAHLHQCMNHMSEMWQQHHTYNGAALVAVGDFVLHAAGWTQRDPVPIFAVFDGWSPVSGVLNPEIAPAIEALRADPDAAALLTGDAPAAERLAKLRGQLPAVDAYVRGVGFRIAAGFDLTNPTVVERPDLVLGRLAAAFGYDADHSTERADALAAELRDAVPEDQRAAFDDMPLTHGNAWSIYFSDPEHNGVEVFIDTPWHVQQPQAKPLDLTKSNDDIVATTQAAFSEEPEFGDLTDFYEGRAAHLANRSTAQ